MSRKPTIAQVVQVLKEQAAILFDSYKDCDGEVSCANAKRQIDCLKRAIEIVKAKGGK